MVSVQSLIIVLLVTQTCIAAAFAGDRASLREAAAVIGQKHSERHTRKNARMTPVTPLDRVAAAVDGAESSHGKGHRQLVTSGQLNLGDRQLIEIYCQHTLQISAQISNFWVLDALCSAAVVWSRRRWKRLLI